MRRLILVALAATALASPVSARDMWNGSGFSLDHKFHSPFDNMFSPLLGGGVYAPSYIIPGGDARIIHVPPNFNMGDREDTEVVETESARRLREQEAAARVRAIRDQHICAPVVLYTDDGVIRHRALGCF